MISSLCPALVKPYLGNYIKYWTPTLINFINCSGFSEGPSRWSRGTGALALWEEAEGSGISQPAGTREGSLLAVASVAGEVTEQTEAIHTAACGTMQEASGLR